MKLNVVVVWFATCALTTGFVSPYRKAKKVIFLFFCERILFIYFYIRYLLGEFLLYWNETYFFRYEELILLPLFSLWMVYFSECSRGGGRIRWKIKLINHVQFINTYLFCFVIECNVVYKVKQSVWKLMQYKLW